MALFFLFQAFESQLLRFPPSLQHMSGTIFFVLVLVATLGTLCLLSLNLVSTTYHIHSIVSITYFVKVYFMFDQKIFSDRLKLLRAGRKISSQVLAEAVGVSRPAISQFENAANYPHVNTLCALADYFNVSVDYLLGRTDNPDVNQ